MSGILNSGKIQTLLTRWTAAKAAFLDAAITSRASQTSVDTVDTVVDSIKATVDSNLDVAVSTVGAKPPTALAGLRTTNATIRTGISVNALQFPGTLATASASTYNAWTEIVGVASDSGVIQLLSIWQDTGGNASSLTCGWRLSIDGTVVASSDNDFWQDSAEDGDGVEIIGATNDTSNIILEAIPFSSSFSLEVRKNTNSAGSIALSCAYKYYTT